MALPSKGEVFLLNYLVYISVDSLIIGLFVFFGELSYMTIIVYFNAQIVPDLDSGSSFVLPLLSL